MKITIDNYHKNTTGNFKALDIKEATALLDAYKVYNRKKNKPRYMQVEGFGEYEVVFVSKSKNSFFKSRSFSFYFRKKGARSIIRISDHWSKSKKEYKKSNKLNCGNIRSCYWTNLKGESFSYRASGEKFDSTLIGGKISFNSLDVKY